MEPLPSVAACKVASPVTACARMSLNLRFLRWRRRFWDRDSNPSVALLPTEGISNPAAIELLFACPSLESEGRERLVRMEEGKERRMMIDETKKKGTMVRISICCEDTELNDRPGFLLCDV